MLFFFKQKTAYEMRISDWSSDVCSSDLRFTIGVGEMLGFLGQGTLLLIPKRLFGRECTFPVSLERPGDQAVIRVDRFVTTAHERRLVARSEEHTSELQSLMRISYAVFCLKKKTKPMAADTSSTTTKYHLVC